MGLPISSVIVRPHSALRASSRSAARVIRVARSANDVVLQRGKSSAARATRRSTSAGECGSNVRSVSPVAGLIDAMATALPLVEGWTSAPAHADLAALEHLEEQLSGHGGLGTEDAGGAD